VRLEALVGDDLAEVGGDLRVRRVAPRPVGVLRERERVQRRRDVAPAAGVGVLPPDAADVVALLEDHDVVMAGPLERRGDGDAAEPRTDDGDPR
jgi:hypothetical protein